LQKTPFPLIQHKVDFCVIGGGMAGLTAAIAAARHGASVLLMQDRPVLGGNASSEIRVHICGADRHNQIPNLRETGILEEIRLENLRRNPNRNFSIWDTILYEKMMAEPNISLLLNCTCQEAVMDGELIESVTGWQMTTQTYHIVEAQIFADCSGDAILAPLTGAAFRMGREARAEFGESIAPEEADERTMGMTCLFQSRQYDTPQPFTAPAWAYTYDDCEELPFGAGGHRWWEMGYWWIELGGEHHSIQDTEKLRDELLKIVYGIWDHLKNRCQQRADTANYALEWVQFLPGKRESRRYEGAHILSQVDIEAEGRFDDLVAYGGWTMDDHHPAGFNTVQIGAPATIWHEGPSPFGIPYRALFSRNVPNLMFAGRNISATHAAMSSTRLMGTASSMGQAVGTAVSIAIRKKVLPDGVLDHIDELQQTLLADDAYLPWITKRYTDLTAESRLVASQGDPEPLRDGFHRSVGEKPHCWVAQPADWAAYHFPTLAKVEAITLILDSALDQNIAMSYHQKDDQLTSIPVEMPRDFDIEGLVEGEWQVLTQVRDNYQRLARISIGRTVMGLRFVLKHTWGGDSTRIFAFYMDP
jgi:hypothetical protein